jgi:O-antigen/teichoic acid export membrane protein
LYAYEKQAFIYKLGIVMAAINIVLDILFIKRFGALGAACCFAATTVVGTTIGTVYTCRLMKLRYPVTSIFKILLATVIMGTVMEIVILQNYQLLGFVVAVVAGAFVYLVSALVLGTFEGEDYTLLRSLERVLPGKSKRVVHWLVDFIASFKSPRSELQ